MSEIVNNSFLEIGIITESGQYNEFTQIGDNIIKFNTENNKFIIQNGNNSSIIIDMSNNILIN